MFGILQPRTDRKPVSEPERARLSVRFFLDRLRDQIELFEVSQFPGALEGPHLWIRLASGILDTADSYLERSESANPEEALKLTKDAAELCSVAYDHLGHLQGATSDQIPWSVVEPLVDWFVALGINNTVFFRAELKRNYEIKQFDEKEFLRFRDASSSLSDLIRNEIKWPILRVTVPSAALSILPHFAIVAHEVGHRVKATYNTAVLQPIINEAVARISATLGGFDPQTAADFQGVVYRWVAEFASEAVAFYLTGPASFFSIDFTQLAAKGHHGIGLTHPAHHVRRAVMFRQLTTGSPSFADIFERYTGVPLTETLGSSLLPPAPDKARLLQEMLLRSRALRTDTVISELNDSAPALADAIYNDVHAHLNTHSKHAQYTVAQYEEDLRSHLEAMTFTIPPIESGISIDARKPSQLTSIINVGWAAVLTRVDKIRVRPDPRHPKTGNLSTIHNLLLKAVELSEAKRRWDVAQ